MNINAIISPEDAPDRSAAPPGSLKKRPRKSKASTAKGRADLSKKPPQHDQVHGYTVQSNHATATTTQDGLVQRDHVSRAASGMDTLADLASMQHQQVLRTKSGGLSKAKEQKVPSKPISAPAPLSRPSSHTGSNLNLMTGASKFPKLATYDGQALSPADLQAARDAANDIAESPFNYSSYLQLIAILRRGLVSHVSGSDGRPGADGASYELLEELQQAYQDMQARFALGEDLWQERVEDAQMTATTVEKCVEVLDLCQQGLHGEVGSVKLWRLYGNWMLALYLKAHPEASQERFPWIQATDFAWSDEAIREAADDFPQERLLDVWERGVEATKHQIADSHLIWDVYMEIVLQDLDANPKPEDVRNIRSLFIARLHEPHATWEDTCQRFSGFLSKYDNAAYEETMVAINKSAAMAKKRYLVRVPFESQWQQAIDAGDTMAEIRVLKEYMDWEMGLSRKKNYFSFDLLHSLFERALLRLPRQVDLWDDYLTFLVDETLRERGGGIWLREFERACRHCPWAGSLWSHFIRFAERVKMSHDSVQSIKHRATSTGLLDDGGLEEILTVHTAWCGFLRRRAFQPDSTDEDLDVAEVGIRSAIEDMETLGQKKYGTAYQGDPQYRLERLYIKFLSQCRNFQSARHAWKSLIDRRGNSYEFWLAYANWEMGIWAIGIQDDQEINTAPIEATAVLRQALARTDLDWPEKMIESYLHHCEDQESIDELQAAVVATKKAARVVAKRRQDEMQASQMQAAQSSAPVAEQAVNGKRKRTDGAEIEYESAKRRRSAEPNSLAPPDAEATVPPKRDRENTVVIVKNLPAATTTTRVRQFFRECGTIIDVDLAPDGETATATIEFETKEDALAAETRHLKRFDGNEIEVQLGVGSTLFVTNFPPTADEEYIRATFSPYGKIIDIRFPSLKYNTHRRFCYVQLTSPAEAMSATELHGKLVADGLHLSVQISAPNRKQDRHGALHDGRELYVSNIDWSATEDEVAAIFAKYGKVEKVRIPRNMAGKSKGMGFVVFASPDEASAALDLNDTKFKSRILSVVLSTPNPTKRHARAIVAPVSASPQPPDGSAHPHSRSASPGQPEPLASSHPSRAEIAARTLALLDLPDTVNDARVRALMAPHGPLTKVILRPDHQGAIVEFADAVSAGKAGLAIDGHEIMPGRRLRVGTVRELLDAKAEKRSGSGVVAASLIRQAPGPIKRPQASRRGGLGARRHGVGLGFTAGSSEGKVGSAKAASSAATLMDGNTRDTTAAAAATIKDDDAMEGYLATTPAPKPKSNADFKALFATPASGGHPIP